MTENSAQGLPQTLVPSSLPLYGSRLIEASAGTGKTWTIAALYVRLILGHGTGTPTALLPANILVMTFTRAATMELAERIRERLTQAAQYFRQTADELPQDDYLEELLQSYGDAAARSHAAWKLESAAQVMDEAAILTIDAWCQRVLHEFAALTGTLDEATLAPSTTEIADMAALDYWRQHVYPLAMDALELVLERWPNALLWQQEYRYQPKQNRPSTSRDWDIQQPLPQLLQALEPAYHGKLRELAKGWDEKAELLREWLDEQTNPKSVHKKHWNGTKLQARYYNKWLDELKAWTANPTRPMQFSSETARQRLTAEGLQEARKSEENWDVPEPIKALEVLWQAQARLPDVQQLLLQHASLHTARRFDELKQQQGVFDFADALNKVEQALTGTHAATLQKRLAERYPVALIDEFQDTSAQQYRVFSHIYRPQSNQPDHALLVIGDPKQSIYRFRGADINSYLQVRQATSGRHYSLDTNYRSTQALVEAINHCFVPAENRPGSGAFRYRFNTLDGATDNPLPFLPVHAKGRAETFCAGSEALPAMQIVGRWEATSKEASNAYFAQSCAEQIVQWLNDESVGFRDVQNGFTRLRPADIAILVRDRSEANELQNALRQRRLAAVYLSDRESVFTSGLASDLVAWLQAVANPIDVKLARAALASQMMALPIAALEALADDEQILENHLLLLQDLHDAWRKLGVLPMLRQTLHRLDLPARWLADPTGGERKLTNYLHLAELLQQAARTVEGEQALMRWLIQQIHAANSGQAGDADEQIVRLESDADLVKIITIHKSKGLEYPVVMLPFACNYKAAKNSADASTDDAETPADDAVTSPDSDEERLREDLRLFYVALTRARHALWLGFASVKKGKYCASHRCAWGYLLTGENSSPLEAAAWESTLQEWGQPLPQIQIQTGSNEIACSRFIPRQAQHELAVQRDFQAQLDRHWNISSFSALIRNVQRTTNPAALWQPLLARRADDEQGSATPELQTHGVSTPNAPWHQLPGGPRLGNFLHDQLEWLGRDGFPRQLSSHAAERLQQSIDKAGWSNHAPGIQNWLDAVLQTPLPPLQPNILKAETQAAEPCLADLGTHVNELEFWLPAHQLDSGELDHFCQQWLWPQHGRPHLPQRTAHGMLMGFADLVFEYQGRYWILDYKSNFLGGDASAYSEPALQQTVLQHRYDLQAMLYLLALHRLLKARLGERYQPAHHLGGALYWFLRGLDAPSRGLLHLPGNPDALDALDQWLNQASHTTP